MFCALFPLTSASSLPPPLFFFFFFFYIFFFFFPIHPSGFVNENLRLRQIQYSQEGSFAEKERAAPESISLDSHV